MCSDSQGAEFSAHLREQHTPYYAAESSCILCSDCQGRECSDCPGFQHTRYYALESTCTLCSVSQGTEFPCTPESSTHVVMHLKVPVLYVRIAEELSFLHVSQGGAPAPPFFSLADCICTVYLFIVVCSPQRAAHTVFHRFPIYCVFRLPRQ